MIELVIEQRRRDLGGFEVGRVLSFAKRRMVGPFVFFDHMGPVGLATLTYLFEGEIMHRDSVGSEQGIQPGEVNWMIAGRGITHSERFERARREGGRMNGIQAWVALPTEHEETDPSFAHHAAAELPMFKQRGARARLIAGEAMGARSPVHTHSPLFYIHCELADGARVELPANYPERAAYVAAGAVEVNGERFTEGRMLVFQGRPVLFPAAGPAVLMLLGGEPVGERFIDWNFVSSSKERIAQAKADWRAGRMKLPDLDNGESIPLAPEPGAPANPMS